MMLNLSFSAIVLFLPDRVDQLIANDNLGNLMSSWFEIKIISQKR